MKSVSQVERILPDLRDYLDRLSAVAFHAEESRTIAIGSVADWLRSELQARGEASVVIICTGNSRRSVLGAMLGNALADYFGMRVSFKSAGTKPTAVNSRSVRALREIGFQIKAVGKEATRGLSNEVNPIYSVQWRVDPTFQVLEFSKYLADPSLPQTGFAAIMVCDEASETCPLVPGAAIRVSVPFEDPKKWDAHDNELTAYRERRDEIGRTIFEVLSRARIS